MRRASTEEAEKLLDREAKPTLKRIGKDRDRAPLRLRPALDVIKQYLFSSKLDVNFLWRQSGLTKKYASAWFSEALQVTPWTYITDRDR
jgi:hypothetical protein